MSLEIISPDVQELADKIHNSRMLSGPACDQCLQIARKRIENKPEGYVDEDEDAGLPDEQDDDE